MSSSSTTDNWRSADKSRQRAQSLSYAVPSNARRALSNVNVNNSYSHHHLATPGRHPPTPSRHPATPSRHPPPTSAITTPGQPTTPTARGSFTDPPARRTFPQPRPRGGAGGLYSRSLCYDSQPHNANRGSGNATLAGIDENALWDSHEEHGISTYFDLDEEEDDGSSFSFNIPQPSLGEMILKDSTDSSFASDSSGSWYYHHPQYQQHHRTTTGASFIGYGNVLNPLHGGSPMSRSLNLNTSLASFGQPLDEEGFHAYYSNINVQHPQQSQSFNLEFNLYDKLNHQQNKDTAKTKSHNAYVHNVNHQHQQNRHQQNNDAYSRAYSQDYPSYTGLQGSNSQRDPPAIHPSPAKPATQSVQCTLCSRPSPTVVLHPCMHKICTSCLTSSLNIVGEKAMRCQVSGCCQEVADFELVPATASSVIAASTAVTTAKEDTRDPEIAFEFDEDLVRSSTPRPNRVHKNVDKEVIILRIDNVPWDITPPALIAWLSLPPPILLRAHVLLDRKGKTASHAFVEVKGEDWARMVLRGEIADPTADASANPRAIGQRGVLGEGKRKRGVTITRGAMGELMSALFPSYRGAFVSATGEPLPVPSVNGPSRGTKPSVGNLLSMDDVKNLASLIRAPTHFVKDATLPVYALVSILAKYPSSAAKGGADTTVREELLNITQLALDILQPYLDASTSDSKVGQQQNDVNSVKSVAEVTMTREGAQRVAKELIDVALCTQAFTQEQIQSLRDSIQGSREIVADRAESEVSDVASSFGTEEASISFQPEETCYEEFVSAKQDFEFSQDCDTGEAGSFLDTDDLRQLSAPAIVPHGSTHAKLASLGLGRASAPTFAAVCAAATKGPPTVMERTASAGNVLDLKYVARNDDDSADASDVNLDELAKEFGVEARIVQALAKRLATGGGRNVTC